MNYVAGILLQYLPENQAFWLFCSVIHDKKYDLRLMYGEGLYKLHMCTYIVKQATNEIVQLPFGEVHAKYKEAFRRTEHIF